MDTIDPAPELSHVAPSGAAHMVDVSQKEITERVAEARGAVLMAAGTLALIRDNGLKKGDVLAVARIAGILAAKRTSELIPLCHGLSLTAVDVDFELRDDPHRVEIRASARTRAQTGVEMEALTAVAVAALNIYDMCKAVDRGMEIGRVRVTFKEGGRSGRFRAE